MRVWKTGISKETALKIFRKNSQIKIQGQTPASTNSIITRSQLKKQSIAINSDSIVIRPAKTASASTNGQTFQESLIKLCEKFKGKEDNYFITELQKIQRTFTKKKKK